MNKNPQYLLITTAEEQTWEFDNPVIFLGKWCIGYNKKDLWEKMDYKIAEPYNYFHSELNNDKQLITDFENLLLPLIVKELNKFHNTNYSQRFWSILIAHWLRRFITVTLNRINTLEKYLDNKYCTKTIALEIDNRNLIPNDSYDAQLLFSSDLWNSNFFIDILNITKPDNLIVKKKKYNINIKKNIYHRLSIYKAFFYYIQKTILLFKRKTDSVIIGSYLTKIVEFKLQLALKEIPFKYKTFKINVKSEPNFEKRNLLGIEFLDNLNQKKIKIIHSLLYKYIPVTFLEGFHELAINVKKLNWPTNPKFIYTCNNFDTDDIFKLYTALLAEKGVPYYIGQHGNNYGTTKYLHLSLEEIIADKFLTFGWKGLLKQHKIAYNFLVTDKNKYKLNEKGGLLLVESVYFQSIFPWDVSYEFEHYFNEQFIFIENLTLDIKNNLVIKLHPSTIISKGAEHKRLFNYNSKLIIDHKKNNFKKLISKSRLVVFAYDSTGILELLTLNIPILAFWQNEYDYLIDEAKPFYTELVKAGVFHFSPITAAVKVNQIWNNVDNWWSSTLVQEARLNFCSNYSKFCNKPVTTLKKLLIE